MKIKIAPSILSSDFSKLQEEVDRIQTADYVHLDVMDGHFVPNLTFGPVVIKNLKTKLFKDSHLMIEDPEKYAKPFVDAGVDLITFHAEVVKDCKKTAALIRNLGVKVGVSINPDKPLSLIKNCLDDVDMVLIMSVYPGFGGQKFMPEVLDKVRELRKLKPELDIEIDGGIDDKTVVEAVKAGANVIVAGSYVYSGEPQERIAKLRSAAENALKQ